MAKAKSPSTGFQEPVYNIASIFTARRDLRQAVKFVLGDSELNVEEADILVLLYGLRERGWPDCPVLADGYVKFRDLKSITVHDASLFGRRIHKLQSMGFVHVRSSREVDVKAHANAQQVRIEEKGIKEVKPIWERYARFSEHLLKEFLKELVLV